jgi:hypothetical protein
MSSHNEGVRLFAVARRVTACRHCRNGGTSVPVRYPAALGLIPPFHLQTISPNSSSALRSRAQMMLGNVLLHDRVFNLTRAMSITANFGDGRSRGLESKRGRCRTFLSKHLIAAEDVLNRTKFIVDSWHPFGTFGQLS